jgi:beta-1,4-mannosyl-glycoprotein beta-1,4-N-acetylglucosaminyltransferase
MRTWSLSPFLNELDVFEIRLAELDSVVDIFVIAEATQTHSGIPRELVFPENKERFAPWIEKIRYIPVDFPPGLAEWDKERYQRDALGAGLVGLEPNDVVLVSDLDEIPRREVVHMDVKRPFSMSFPIHPYRLDWRWDSLEDGYCRCTVSSGSKLQRRHDGFYAGVHEIIVPTVFPDVRKNEHTHLVGEFGWHFTYIGDADQILAKAASIADDWVKGAGSPESAQAAIDNGTDVFGRGYRTASKVPIETLPAHVGENVERFAHILTPR